MYSAKPVGSDSNDEAIISEAAGSGGRIRAEERAGQCEIKCSISSGPEWQSL